MTAKDRRAEAWFFLLRVHGRIWASREIPLAERVQACDLVWELALKVSAPKTKEAS